MERPERRRTWFGETTPGPASLALQCNYDRSPTARIRPNGRLNPAEIRKFREISRSKRHFQRRRVGIATVADGQFAAAAGSQADRRRLCVDLSRIVVGRGDG